MLFCPLPSSRWLLLIIEFVGLMVVVVVHGGGKVKFCFCSLLSILGVNCAPVSGGEHFLFILSLTKKYEFSNGFGSGHFPLILFL